MEKYKVAVLKTSPETVVEDYIRLMKMADFEHHLPKDKDTILNKINISWQYYFPGCGDPKEMEIVGEDISRIDFQFHGKQNTFVSRGQKLIYHGPLNPLDNFHLRSPIARWSYYASRLYHDAYWYRCVGKSHAAKTIQTEWGKLFQSYGGRQS